MPYSESIGFVADTDDPDKIDFTTYVVAHEMAHQYWAHQVIGADMQGGTLTSETLAQYSALMVMKHLYGPDKIRRFLKYELDGYLSAARASGRGAAARAGREPGLHPLPQGRAGHVPAAGAARRGAVNRALARFVALSAQVPLQGRALPALCST
jgi:ABC-2 type transport system permease protein